MRSKTLKINFDSTNRKIGLAATVVLAVFIIVILFGMPSVDRNTVIAYGREIPGLLFMVLFFLLPLLGVPILWLLIIVGLKYGTVMGMLVATVGTGFHNLAAYAATKSWLQSPIQRAIRKLGYDIPSIQSKHQLWFTAVFTGVPGLPYAVKLYSLALTNISFRIYFWVGWPIYAVSCIVYVALGDAVASLGVGWFIALALFAVGCLYQMRRLLERRAGYAGISKKSSADQPD